MFQEVYFCTVLYDCTFYVLWNIKNIEITIIKNSTTINFLNIKNMKITITCFEPED
jgi:hypothetical protein